MAFQCQLSNITYKSNYVTEDQKDSCHIFFTYTQLGLGKILFFQDDFCTDLEKSITIEFGHPLKKFICFFSKLIIQYNSGQATKKNKSEFSLCDRSILVTRNATNPSHPLIKIEKRDQDQQYINIIQLYTINDVYQFLLEIKNGYMFAIFSNVDDHKFTEVFIKHIKEALKASSLSHVSQFPDLPISVQKDVLDNTFQHLEVPVSLHKRYKREIFSAIKFLDEFDALNDIAIKRKEELCEKSVKNQRQKNPNLTSEVENEPESTSRA